MAYPDRCGAIGVTQPRRVAAIASAQRVAVEMGCRVGGVVGYQVKNLLRASVPSLPPWKAPGESPRHPLPYRLEFGP